MDIRLLRGLLAASLCLCAASATAADFDYDWVTVGATHNNHSGLTDNGWFVDGSHALSSQFTVEGSFYRLRAKQDENACVTGPSANFCDPTGEHWDYLRLGMGWHWSVSDSADFLADALYAHNKVHEDFLEETFFVTLPCPAGSHPILNGCARSASSDTSDNGYQLDVGLRVRCTCSLEFKGYLSHLGLSNGFGAANYAAVEAAWRFMGPWTLVLGGRHYTTPANQYRLGLRYQF